MLEFAVVNWRIGSLCLWVIDRSLTEILAYGLNSSKEYLAFFESLARMLNGTPMGDSVLLGYFNAHASDKRKAFKGLISRSCFLDLKLGGVLLLDLCVSHNLSIISGVA